jgi:hypothetical protein
MAVDGDKPAAPEMRVVSNNPNPQPTRVPDCSQSTARFEVDSQLASLACNLMRISRGAGQPHRLVSDCINVVAAFRSYYDAFGHFPDVDLLRKTVSFLPEREGWQEGHEEIYAIEQMTSGALQVAASRIGGHRLQERAGEKELLDGVRSYERYREEEQAKYAAKFPATIKLRATAKTKVKKKSIKARDK